MQVFKSSHSNLPQRNNHHGNNLNFPLSQLMLGGTFVTLLGEVFEGGWAVSVLAHFWENGSPPLWWLSSAKWLVPRAFSTHFYNFYKWIHRVLWIQSMRRTPFASWKRVGKNPVKVPALFPSWPTSSPIGQAWGFAAPQKEKCKNQSEK